MLNIKNLFIFFLLFIKLIFAQTFEELSFDKALLEPNGDLMEASLPKILSKANFKEECLKAKKIGAKGSFNTKQLFLITNTCDNKEYILKEARDGFLEGINLKKISDYPGIIDLLPDKNVKDFPKIALPLAYLSYSDAMDNFHHLILIDLFRNS